MGKIKLDSNSNIDSYLNDTLLKLEDYISHKCKESDLYSLMRRDYKSYDFEYKLINEKVKNI